MYNRIRLLDILSEAEEKGCPLPTQDIDLNLKNRNKAFKKYNYGPAAARTCQAWVSGGPIKD